MPMEQSSTKELSEGITLRSDPSEMGEHGPGKECSRKRDTSIIKLMRQEQVWHVGGMLKEEHVGAEVRERRSLAVTT